MMGWSLVPYAQLDHALNHFQKNRADALILHAPIAGIEPRSRWSTGSSERRTPRS